MPTLTEAIDYLDVVNGINFPLLLFRYPKDSKNFVNHKSLIIDFTFQENLCKEYVELLEKSGDQKARITLHCYKQNVQFIREHIDTIQTNNQRAIPENIPGTILAYIQKDDAVRLETLLKRCEDEKDISLHYDYALRVAACGSPRCLNYLMSTKRANILAPGKSGTIALHYAIDRKRSDCIETLLNATNSLPSTQLLFGKAPNRPIDWLERIKDEKKFITIKNIILNAINDSVSEETTNPKIREEIENLLIDQTHQFTRPRLPI